MPRRPTICFCPVRLLFFCCRRGGRRKPLSGRSAARLAHLTGGQGVAGSNPVAPTIFNLLERKGLQLASPAGNGGAINPKRVYLYTYRQGISAMSKSKPDLGCYTTTVAGARCRPSGPMGERRSSAFRLFHRRRNDPEIPHPVRLVQLRRLKMRPCALCRLFSALHPRLAPFLHRHHAPRCLVITQALMQTRRIGRVETHRPRTTPVVFSEEASSKAVQTRPLREGRSHTPACHPQIQTPTPAASRNHAAASAPHFRLPGGVPRRRAACPCAPPVSPVG